MDDTTKKMLRQTTMPGEIVEGVECGCTGYVGRAMGILVAGEEVIVIARRLPSLNIVYNYLQGKDGKNGTLRESACPEVVVLAKQSVDLDDEL
jgi:hypothetical protein